MGKGRKASYKKDKRPKRRRAATSSRKPRAATSSSASQSSSASSSSSCSSAEKKDERVLRKGVCMYALPFRRLQQLVRRAEETFDETWTMGMTGAETASLLWLVTRINPGVKSSQLGAKTYKEGKRAVAAAAKRLRVLMGEQQHKLMVTEAVKAGPDNLRPIVESYGFDPAWLDGSKEKNPKKGRKSAPLSDAGRLQELERQLAAARREALAPAQDTVPRDASAVTLHGLASVFAAQASLPTVPALGGTVARSSSAEEPRDLVEGRNGLAPAAESVVTEPRGVVPQTPAGTDLTSEQQSGIQHGEAAVATRRAQSKAKGGAKGKAKAKALGRQHSASQSSRDEDETSGGEHTRSPTESGVAPALAPAQDAEQVRHRSDREMAERDAVAPPKCIICHEHLKADEDKTALQCGHAFHTDCINRYAETKNCPLEHSCPFKCAANEVLAVNDDGEEAEQTVPLSSGLLARVQAAEAAAGATLS